MKSLNIPFQAPSLDIWSTKYQLKNKSDEPVDLTIEDTYERVARALADVEAKDQSKWADKFQWALQMGAIPAGRIMSNAGASDHKPATSTINCTVAGTIEDSMDDILLKNYEAGLTLKAGCGIGYEFSTLRPSGAFVAGAGATTSGPLSFMDIFDKMCFTVSSAGGRRGAQMATFDIHHPDVLEFVKAKREDGRLRQFNCSLLITEQFIEAVKSDSEWTLSFPVSAKEVSTEGLDLTDSTQFVYRDFPITKDYITNGIGQVACRIYETVKARDIFDAIMTSTYDFAEPGFILIDKVNEMNNNWFCENIRATNPCGEQPLPAYGSCLLGSVNLTKFVVNPYTETAYFDFDSYREVVSVFTRMLDNVVEINGLPLAKQREELVRKRRHGMGILGLGSAITMLGMSYGDSRSIELTEKISFEMTMTSYKEGLALAKEKGAAPIMEEEFEVTPSMLAKRPEMVADGFVAGDMVKGKVLWSQYSRIIQSLAKLDPELNAGLQEFGSRFTHATSIAPTGTISLSLANNVSNGIEPSFAHHYSRNVIVEGKKTKVKMDVFSYELLAYRHVVNDKAMPDQGLPEYFISADSISPSAHIDIQAAAQKWVDSSISKTINVATDIPYEEFKQIYLDAHAQGLKGCTTFRFNPEAFQGVLVKEEDLANTEYEFTLDDGTKIKCKGNEQIEYDGELHSAANLYDALKEGTYGKH